MRQDNKIFAYGYCRMDGRETRTTKQYRTILRKYPNAIIIEEPYYGEDIEYGYARLRRLLNFARAGETVVVCDSIRRFGCTLEDAEAMYALMTEKGITVVVL